MLLQISSEQYKLVGFFPLGIKTGKFYWQLMSGFDTFDIFEARMMMFLCKEKQAAALL